MKTRPVALLILAVWIAGTSSLLGCGRNAGMPPPGPVEVKAITVEVGAAQLYVDKVGEVRGWLVG
jgi:hypothetical protein